ncbi:hypothetical protein RYX36_000219 [Vicia faba]
MRNEEAETNRSDKGKEQSRSAASKGVRMESHTGAGAVEYSEISFEAVLKGANNLVLHCSSMEILVELKKMRKHTPRKNSGCDQEREDVATPVRIFHYPEV